ncbi:MAG TPA: hypothetical protein VIF33_07285, partial [Casimicrobiaceae bacterium]
HMASTMCFVLLRAIIPGKYSVAPAREYFRGSRLHRAQFPRRRQRLDRARKPFGIAIERHQASL